MRRRGGWRKGFGERLGRYSTKFKQAISNRDVIWLHAVSVGEVNICVQLIKVLQPRLPNLKLVVSTTTTTGMSELHKKLPAEVGKIYYPMVLASMRELVGCLYNEFQMKHLPPAVNQEL